MQGYKKLDRLKGIITSYGSCLVAFSGGVDSSFLLKVASSVLPKDKIIAVTADSPTYPVQELKLAKKFALKLGVKHKIIHTNELSNERFARNPKERCYFCKKELFTELRNIARANNIKVICDASNLSDKKDFRPGSLAKRELNVRSPLQEAGFNKKDVRLLSRRLNLTIWDKPALACLASRVPYGARISRDILLRINAAEVLLKKYGFNEVRVRDYNETCRIEVNRKDIRRLVNIGQSVVDKIKKLGYNYITADLEGYRTGSMNEVIER